MATAFIIPAHSDSLVHALCVLSGPVSLQWLAVNEGLLDFIALACSTFVFPDRQSPIGMNE